MAANRKRGSDRGRTSVDWEAAFAFYASLPDRKRSYQAVADEFSVSVRTVETHGRDGGWKERLRGVQAEAAVAADAELARQRAEMLGSLEKLIDASLATYAQQLRAGSVKVAPVDLQRLFKLRQDRWDQEAAATTAARTATTPVEDVVDREARKLDVVRAPHEAGAFDRLQAPITPPDTNTQDKEEE